MGDPLKKVQPGDKLVIPASTFNTFVDVADDWKRRRLSGGRGTPRQAQQSSGIVLVRNDSGADRARFDVLGIDVPVVTPTTNEAEFAGRPVLSCVLPTADHAGRFVILQDPLPRGSVGFARVAGCSLVMVDVTSEDHEAAEIEAGEAGHLASAPTGSAAIIWKEAGTGEKWALVRLGPQRFDYVVFNQEFRGYGYYYPDTMWFGIPLRTTQGRTGGDEKKTGEIPQFAGEVVGFAVNLSFYFYGGDAFNATICLINHTTGDMSDASLFRTFLISTDLTWGHGGIRVAPGSGFSFLPGDIIGVAMKTTAASNQYLSVDATVSMTAIRTGEGTARTGFLVGTPEIGSITQFTCYPGDTITFGVILTNSAPLLGVQLSGGVFSGSGADMYDLPTGNDHALIAALGHVDFVVRCRPSQGQAPGDYVCDWTVGHDTSQGPVVFHFPLRLVEVP